MPRNVRAAGDSRFARTGKDGAIYDEDGTLLATVDSFRANVTYNNAKYTVLGDPQEHETAATYAVNLTMSQVCVEDDKFIQGIAQSMQNDGELPYWTFQGSMQGRNGSEERFVYNEVIPSGEVDLQNITTGDVVKRNWNFFVNRPPKLQSLLSLE